MTCYSTLRYEIYTQLKNEHNKCWYNAAYNRLVYKNLQGLKLHWVVGGRRSAVSSKSRGNFLGFEMKNGEIQLMTQPDRRWTSSHAWLEDDSGNVWDYIQPEDVAKYREYPDSQSYWNLEAGYIQGVPHSVLKELGYELYAYPKESQKKILEKLLDQDTHIPAEVEETLEMIQL